VADPIATAAQVRAAAARFKDLPETTYPDDDIDALVSEFAEIFTKYRGVAPTPTATAETLVLRSPSSVLVLRWPLVSALTSVTVDGIAVDGDSLTLDPAGTVTYAGTFSAGVPIVATYTHGLAAVPATLTRAVVQYVCAVFRADESGTGRDVIAQTFDGGITRYSTPDMSMGRPTGWLEVDRLLNSLDDYRMPGIA
jgi:hypothetical protein